MVKAEIEKLYNDACGEICEVNQIDHFSSEDYKTLEKLYREKGHWGGALQKAVFVEELKKFYMETVGNGLGIVNMEYTCSDDMYFVDEKIKVSFDSGYKLIYVNFDSIDAMFKDFARFLMNFDSYEWEEE